MPPPDIRDDRQFGPQAAYGKDGLNALHLRHDQVGDDEVNRLEGYLAERLAAVGGVATTSARSGEKAAKAVADQLVVVDKEDALVQSADGETGRF